MWRTLIYYKPKQIDLAIKLQDNYIAHKKETDIISAEEHDDIEYAIENQYIGCVLSITFELYGDQQIEGCRDN